MQARGACAGCRVPGAPGLALETGDRTNLDLASKHGVYRLFAANRGSLIHLRDLPTFSNVGSAETSVALEARASEAAKLSA